MTKQSKKAKMIHLSEEAIRTISIEAVTNGSNFKNYVEQHLEDYAKKKPNTKRSGRTS